ncbi:putative manganese-dependent inorganic diphosphatase [Treponema brennaborense]|uniref:inorganic diphosphatase n=1 Tax=Treponema brennaborense (strain DSM 12168 / CIP 105900 / DD5/3) TaxID=906968 RepID=F4LPJ5_TREBD|nr:putative manganese-dependent inorganic diphosphatase [Treponema brennaborense]AEE16006.1 Inorganic diphosphatase [Treponema brennaborense DSM 12168]
MKTVYVIGHRNPDTDSVVSAAAYARLKQSLGQTEHIAARAGKISPQTEYIFDRFRVPIPEYIPDLVPKVRYYLSGECATVKTGTSLWSAIEKMEESDIKVLPVVDEDGTYRSLLHYNVFARNVLKILDPEKEAAVTTSISLVCGTLSAQPVIIRDEEELFKSTILVAAAQFGTFKQMLAVYPPENVIVITGDRTDIQEYCIKQKVRAVVISSGYTLEKPLRDLADKNNVSVLISPYDTSASAMLIVYSSPVSSMADSTIPPVNANDTLRKIRPLLQKSPGRCLPVVDDANRLLGIILESDLIHEANVEVILVDHNELSQAVEGVDNYKIREVIDHHRLGSFSTRYPITFINKPVGATSTIVTNLFRQNRVSIPKEIASILLAGILSDTLILQSATTTEEDRETAEYLSNITNLDIKALGQDVLTAASRLGGRSASEVVHQDMKEYTEEDFSFTVSQIEVDTTDELITRKEEFFEELEIERRSRKTLFSALMVTDITKLTSLLLISSEPAFLQVIGFPKMDTNIYILKDIVSRKKQLIPLLSEQIEKLSAQ